MTTKILDRADTRGHSRTPWLNSYHTFSFDQYWNEERMGWGALRVINDDTVKPKTGFGMHPHKNMEIVSIPLSGELTHGDSEGHLKTIRFGEIQTMTAGTGIIHSEMNNNQDEEVKFLQIWVLPQRNGLKPDYHDFVIKDLLQPNKLNLIVSPNDEVSATLHQNAWFSLGDFEPGQKIEYQLHGEKQGIYIFLLEGEIEAGGETLTTRDGLGLSSISKVDIETKKPSRILLIEIPMLK